jgi:hypothetical protein
LTASATPRSKFLRHPSLRPVSFGAAALLAALSLVVSIDAPAQASPEVLITTAPVWDFEFDSARNGKECPSCNFNTGNSRFAWIDNDRNLWLGWVDFQTGAFIPPDGKGQLLDVGAVPIAVYGNGPEWMSSSTWGSQIVYSRYVPGQEGKPGQGTIAVATTPAERSMDDGGAAQFGRSRHACRHARRERRRSAGQLHQVRQDGAVLAEDVAGRRRARDPGLRHDRRQRSPMGARYAQADLPWRAARQWPRSSRLPGKPDLHLRHRHR